VKSHSSRRVSVLSPDLNSNIFLSAFALPYTASCCQKWSLKAGVLCSQVNLFFKLVSRVNKMWSFYPKVVFSTCILKQTFNEQMAKKVLS
jgi:hypothetical protein